MAIYIGNGKFVPDFLRIMDVKRERDAFKPGSRNGTVERKKEAKKLRELENGSSKE